MGRAGQVEWRRASVASIESRLRGAYARIVGAASKATMCSGLGFKWVSTECCHASALQPLAASRSKPCRRRRMSVQPRVKPALADVPFPSYFSFCSVLLLSLLKFRLKPVLLCCNFYEPLLPS